MNYKKEIKDKLQVFSEDLDYEIISAMLYEMEIYLGIYRIKNLCFGLCTIIDGVVDTYGDDNNFSFSEIVKYKRFFIKMLPNELYSRDGMEGMGKYNFPLRGEDFNSNTFYHYRLMWIKQFIKIIEGDLQIKPQKNK